MPITRRRIANALTVVIVAATLPLALPDAAAALVAARQDFNALVAGASTTDSLPDGSALTNVGAANVGGPGLGFATRWFDTRGQSAGPVTPTADTSDFIGVNDFAGANAPDVAPDGTPVASGVEHNFEFNDGDGRVELRFEVTDLGATTGRALALSYWIADTGYEADDRFEVGVDDGSGVVGLLALADTELEAAASPDDGTANWNNAVFCLDQRIAGGLGEQLSVVVAVDTNASSENVFVDDISLETGVDPATCDQAPGEESRELTIPEIQGASHRSPVDGEAVTTTGVVSAVAFNGAFVADPTGDGDDATSDGIFVFTGSSPTGISAGDQVRVEGQVSEFVPGGAATANLSTTQIAGELTVTGTAGVPAPVVIGLGGRVPPNEIVISDDELPVDLLDPAQADTNPFDPAVDAIDFYESLEGMRVTVEAPQAVSAIREFSPFSSEFFTVPNGGAVADADDTFTNAGGIRLDSGPDNTGDQNPERVQIQIDGTLYPSDTLPQVGVGDQLEDVTGVVNYDFGNFQVNATEVVTIDEPAPVIDDSAADPAPDVLRVASYNVLNLSGDASDDAQRATIAAQIANDLRSPDVVALQEIQDDSGEVDDATVSAAGTLGALVGAIADAGGPTYKVIDIAPVDGATGGVPGGNIRNAYLYRDDRVTLRKAVVADESVLAAIGSDDAGAFDGSRRPLVATFSFQGDEVVVVNNHFSSRFGSTPIFGAIQPFVQAGEEERAAQARAVNDLVDSLLARGRSRVVVLGDLNTFEFTDELVEDLPGAGAERVLTSLSAEVPTPDRYSFIFDGNSQALDHAFVSDALLAGASADYVHVNVDRPRLSGDGTASDHEPLVVELSPRGRGDELIGRAVLPADTFAEGPTSGRFIGDAGPFLDAQPVQGFSAALDAGDGTFLAMSDNGFGSITNSPDYNLRVYRIRPSFETAVGGTRTAGPIGVGDGGIDVLGFVELRDPDAKIPFAIVNHFSDERILTGADFDIESFRIAADGTWWFGDEFGPFLVHTDDSGKVLDAPVSLPDPDGAGELRAPQNPYNEEISTLRVMNAVRAHAEANGSTKTPIVSPWEVMLADDNPATNVPDRLAPPPGLAPASSEIHDVDQLHAAGYDVVPYTVNDPTRMTELLELGVDGLISDRPDLLRQAVADFDPTLILPDGRIDPDRFDAQGHRGARNLRPENTLPAMEAALDALVNTLETDTGVTLDGLAVLDHDPFIEAGKCRRSDGSPYEEGDEVLVRTLSAAEIQAQFVCDGLIRGPEQANDRSLSPASVAFAAEVGLADPYVMPTVENLFDFVDFYVEYYVSGPGSAEPEAAVLATNAAAVRFNIETKLNPRAEFVDRTFAPQAFVDALAGPITARGLEDRAAIQSFDWRTLILAQEQFPQIQTVYLFGDFTSDGTNLAPENGANTPWLAGLFWPYRVTVLDSPFQVASSGGFEGMAVSPDGATLYPMLEKPLAGEEGVLRIFEFDTVTAGYSGRFWRYRLDPRGVAIGDFSLFDEDQGLVIERDGTQGDLEGFKAVFEIRLGEPGAEVDKALAVDLLDIADPAGISLPGEPGDVGLGNPFAFPFVTIESVVVLDDRRIGILNDNNYPFSVGRHVGSGAPDDNEFVIIRLDQRLGRLTS